MKNTTKKKEYFKLFDKAYKITDNYSVDCSICYDRLCEDKESVMLLPYENEYIKEKLHLKKLPFNTIKVGRYKIGFEHFSVPCPVYNKEIKSCGIYLGRPIDCRTFPVVVYFTKSGKMKFNVSDEYCPLAINNFLDEEFILTMKKVWKMFEKLLPKSWKKIYNEFIVNK